jgi:hypothetical protein
VSYIVEPHHPTTWKGFPWAVCRRCGLVYLRNPFTAWAIQKGCGNEEHPEYRKMWEQAKGK